MSYEFIPNHRDTKRYLREAVEELSARGLRHAATWALEQIVRMSDSDDDDCDVLSKPFRGMSRKEVDITLLAREHLQSGEYQRCLHTLQNYWCGKQNFLSDQHIKAAHLHVYLFTYAHYMRDPEGAKRKPKEVPLGTTTETEKRYLLTNQNLQSLHADLARFYWDGHFSGDGFLLFIFAVMTRDLHRQEGHAAQSVLNCKKEQQQEDGRGGVVFEEEKSDVTVRQLLLESLHAFPWNWSCWLELAELCVSEKQPLPSWPDILHCQSRAPYNQYSAVRDSVSVAAKAGLESAASLMYGSFLSHVKMQKHCAGLAMEQAGLAQYTARCRDEDYGRAGTSNLADSRGRAVGKNPEDDVSDLSDSEAISNEMLHMKIKLLVEEIRGDETVSPARIKTILTKSLHLALSDLENRMLRTDRDKDACLAADLDAMYHLIKQAYDRAVASPASKDSNMLKKNVLAAIGAAVLLAIVAMLYLRFSFLLGSVSV